MHDAGFFPPKNIFPNHTHKEILSHYNHVLIGCFKDIFQSVGTNNLAAVLQTLKELNFMLTNRAPELTAHYSIPLELKQVSAKEVPNFINAYLNRPTANNTKYSNRGRPRTRGVQHSRYTRQSSPVPRYKQQSCRSDIHSHSNTDRFTTKLATIIGIDIICIPHLITHVTYPITLIIILLICNVI